MTQSELFNMSMLIIPSHPLLPTARRAPILRGAPPFLLCFKAKLPNPEADSIPSVALMEYLGGGRLFESCCVKDQRQGRCSCTASSKRNDKRPAVAVLVVSCEWNTRGTLDAFCWLKTRPGGRGRGEEVCVQCFLLFGFYLEPKVPQYEMSPGQVMCLGQTPLVV